MKKILIAFVCITIGMAGMAQEIQPAQPGVVYGTVMEKGQPLKVTELENNLQENKFSGKITGKVAEVCQAEGCWIRLQKTDGSTLLVRSKNHAFVMPKDIVGKTVVVDGEATVKEISEAMRKHYAEDAGKSKEEIEKIKGDTKEIIFMAKGVKVI
ncbi:MAG TPA: DUF4920 domain-containing protein [Chitinophagaceae bacterium]|jgi:hypothetical protein|nr:DUF4920 domain-containing protein [Chitinophagaceae bacterium]